MINVTDLSHGMDGDRGWMTWLNYSISMVVSAGCTPSHWPRSFKRKKYAQWLDADDAVVVANAMLIIIGRAMNMLKSQIEAQGKVFEETGGFSERLTAKRIEAREKSKPSAPECPLCGKPMRQRNSIKGGFWGCSAYPDCKGTRPE
jgi:restriction system protein